jgi:hypothetical protein
MMMPADQFRPCPFVGYSNGNPQHVPVLRLHQNNCSCYHLQQQQQQ